MAEGGERCGGVLAGWLAQWLENAGQGQQQQYGDAQCSGVDRERQDGSQAE
jgi:hypothetical protein